jgi:predicted NUDIX family NTP pyrophosphohydrolase
LQLPNREFEEETGFAINGDFISLGEVKQAGGKVVKVWAVKHDLDPATLKSNTFRLEWPPRSGKIQECPEVDSGAWFSLAAAHRQIIKAQGEFLTRLADHRENRTL